MSERQTEYLRLIKSDSGNKFPGAAIFTMARERIISLRDWMLPVETPVEVPAAPIVVPEIEIVRVNRLDWQLIRNKTFIEANKELIS